jgi:hypothetical protein
MQTRHQYSKDVPYNIKSNVEENKLNSIDHAFPYLLLGSNDKTTEYIRSQAAALLMQIFLIWSTMVRSRLIPKTEIYVCCQINLVSLVK